MNEPRPVPPGECTAPHCDCEPGWCLQRTPATFTRTAPTHTGLDPEMGFLLDGANEGELAAYDFACAGMISALKKILDGEDDGKGVGNEPWHSLRRRIIALRDSQQLLPISSAPKDGTEVILKVKMRAGIPGKFLVGHYMPGGFCVDDHPAIAQGWYFWNGAMFDKAAEPIGWSPLPDDKPINGIAATDFHDEGAIARCSYCGRYSLDRNTLGEDRYQPVCECGEQRGWSGSFKKPGPDAKWSGRAPSGVGVSASGHSWHDYGQEKGRNRSWCSRCKLVVWTGEEPDSPCVSMPTVGVKEVPRG